MRKAMPIIGVIVGVIFIIVSFTASPNRELESRDVPRYVGGDAYNFLMESNFRAGEIAASAIYLTGGIIVILISLFKVADNSFNDDVVLALKQFATTPTETPEITHTTEQPNDDEKPEPDEQAV